MVKAVLPSERRGGVGKSRRAEIARKQEAAQAVARRRYLVSTASGPVATTTADLVVLQKDFLGVTGSPAGTLEVEVTRDTDGGMRFYANAPRINNDLYFRFWDDQLEGYASAQNAVSGTGAGSSHAVDHVTAAENAIGEMLLQTGTTSTGRAAFYYSQAAVLIGNGTAWNFEWRGATHNANSDGVNGYVCTMGFGDAWASSGEPVDGVYFAYRQLVDGNFWVCVTRSNSVETKTVTAIAPAYAAMRIFRIEIDSGGTSVAFKIDGTTVATHTTNIPTGAGRQTGIGWKIEKNVGTSSRYFYNDYIGFDATRTAAR